MPGVRMIAKILLSVAVALLIIILLMLGVCA